jgi:hypothetical protein
MLRRQPPELLDHVPLGIRQPELRVRRPAAAISTIARRGLELADDETGEPLAREMQDVCVLVDAFQGETSPAELDIGDRHRALVSEHARHVPTRQVE